MNRLILATKNKGKVAEIAHHLSSDEIAIQSLLDLALEIEIEENEETFAGNATKKAETVAEATGLPVLADDSGLEVDALDGRPGVRSARFGGPGLSDAERNARLLASLSQTDPQKRTARFRAVLAFKIPGREIQLFDGVLSGTIAQAAAGSAGFGYDPIFVPAGYAQTLAELGPEIKEQISHRAEALKAFCAWFERQKRTIF